MYLSENISYREFCPVGVFSFYPTILQIPVYRAITVGAAIGRPPIICTQIIGISNGNYILSPVGDDIL